MPDNTTPLQQEYLVKFDFTTFETGKSMMTRRGGSIQILSKVPKEEIDMAEIKQLCVNEMLRLKPKWNILMLYIKDVFTIVPKKSKAKTNARS